MASLYSHTYFSHIYHPLYPLVRRLTLVIGLFGSSSITQSLPGPGAPRAGTSILNGGRPASASQFSAPGNRPLSHRAGVREPSEGTGGGHAAVDGIASCVCECVYAPSGASKPRKEKYDRIVLTDLTLTPRRSAYALSIEVPDADVPVVPTVPVVPLSGGIA
jgi:hypothetical protein